MIPKIIHYCWLSNDPIPSEFMNYMASWKKNLPDYEFILWNFDRFDINTSIWVKQAFENKKYAFASDYIRLFAVYKFGGIYMDMDIEVLKPFDDLLDSELMLAYESLKTKNLEAGCFGAGKENPFVKRCLEYYLNRSFIKSNGEFDMTPLPKIITPVYKEMVNGKPFDSDYFTAKSLDTGKISVTKNTYTIHHFAGSWTIPIRKKYMKARSQIAKVVGGKVASIILLPMQCVCIIKESGFASLLKKMVGRR